MENEITEIHYYIEGNEETPLVSITQLEGEVRECKEQPDLNALKKLISLIGSQTPTLVVNASNTTKQILTFSPEVTKGMQQGIYNTKNANGILTGVARNSKGNIVEHGKILTKVNPAFVATIGFQVMTIVASQQHLSDIDKKLSDISTTLNKVNEFLLNKRKSEIQTSIEYMNKLSTILKKGGLSESETITYHIQLEMIERQTIEIKNHILLELNAKINKIQDMSFQTAGGTWVDGYLEDLNKNIETTILEIKEAFETYYTILAVRLYNCQIASILPINQTGVQFVLESIKKEYENIDTQKKAFIYNTRQKISEFKAYRASDLTNENYKKSLRAMFHNTEAGMSKKSYQVQRAITHFSETKDKLEASTEAKYLASFNKNNEIIDLKLLA